MTDQWVHLAKLQTPNLQENLNYLASRQHELLAILKNAATSEPIAVQQSPEGIRSRVASAQGSWLFGERDPQQERAALQERAQDFPADAEALVLVGASGGYGLAAWLPKLQENPNLRIVVIEPTPARIYLCMALLNLQAALMSERLHFAAARLNPDNITAALEPFSLGSCQRIETVVAHECSAALDENELANHVTEALQQSRADMLNRLEQQAQEKPSDEPVKRVLIVNCWQGVAGGLHLATIERELKKKGVDVRSIYLSRHRLDAAPQEHRRLVERKLVEAYERFGPDLILSFGYHAPQFVSPEVYDSLSVRWLQTVTNVAYFDTEQYAGETTVLVDQKMKPLFQRRGYQNLLDHTLVADYVREHPISTNGQVPLVFVGNSFAQPQENVQRFWARWQGRDQLKEAIREGEQYLGRIETQADLFDYLTDNPLPQIEEEHEFHEVFRHLLCHASAARRIAVLEALAPMGLLLFGGDWGNVLAQDSPLRKCWRGYLPMEREIEAFANGQIFINIHSVGNGSSTNMRYFNVAGVGGFEISDRKNFDCYLKADEEVVYAESVEEYVEKAKYFLAHPKERAEIGARALERVKNQWTYRHWIENIFQQAGLRLPV